MNYDVTVSENFDNDICALAKLLNISPADVIKRAVVLLKHAVNADEVKLVSNGEEKKVLLK